MTHLDVCLGEIKGHNDFYIFLKVTERHFYAPHRKGGGHIIFGANPVGVGVSVGVSVTLSCLHDIS